MMPEIQIVGLKAANHKLKQTRFRYALAVGLALR
jgi:hypothetical protein